MYSCLTDSSLFANQSACQKWYQSNSAVVSVYYDGLDYTSQEESSSYSIGTASNDLGGQAGLWVGISLVSLVELLAFVIYVVLYFAYGRKYTEVKISDEMRGTDKRYDVR